MTPTLADIRDAANLIAGVVLRTPFLRAPRLSARLLRRFEVSAGEARAVEYHRERFDGRGYYAIPPGDQPLAAHFLVVADSFDAMTSDRPYRPGLTKDEALAEIERNIGTQFHPAVAKAFVALQRGRDPYQALGPEEQEQLRGAAMPYRLRDVRSTRDLRERPELVALGGLVAGLAGVGLHQPWLAAAGAFVTCGGLILHAWLRLRANRLARSLASALALDERTLVFEELAHVLEGATGGDWVALVGWREDGLGGSVEVARGTDEHERALMSWLLREADSHDEVLTAAGHEFGGDGAYVALPLRRENSALTGFFVLHTPRALQRSVRAALAGSLDAIGLALAAEPALVEQPPQAAVTA